MKRQLSNAILRSLHPAGMNPAARWLVLRVTVLSLSLFALTGRAAAQSPPSFARDVKPFLARYCLECHNSQALKGDLDLETFATLRQGGKNGAVFVPGKPDQSRLVLAVEGKIKPAMPPKSARQPSPADARVLRAWVAAGAKDDSTTTSTALPSIPSRDAKPAAITALAYTPDGKVLFAARHKSVVRIEGSKIQEFASLGAPVTALAVRPDGKLLAVASSISGVAGEVSLFDISKMTAGTPVQKLQAHADTILDLVFTPDGKLLATTGYDRLIKLWDLETGKLRHTLKDHSDAVYSLAFDPAGKLLASAGADRAVKVWNVETGVRLYTLSDSTDWVYAVAWRPDGKQLAAAGVDKSLRTWDVTASGGKLALSVFAHDGPIGKLRYAPDSRTLYSLGDDRILKAWDANRLVEKHVFATQPELAQSLALRGDGKEAALGRFDGAVLVLDVSSGKLISQPLPEKPKPPVIARLMPDAAPRGQTVRVILSGEGLANATEIVSEQPGLKLKKLPATKTGDLPVEVTIPADAKLGAYKLRVKSAGGQSAPVDFFVDRFRALSANRVDRQPLALPVTITGVLDEAGKVDRFPLALSPGQSVGVQVVPSHNKLDVLLRIVDRKGTILTESHSDVLAFTASESAGAQEPLVLEIRESNFKGNKDAGYRLHLGNIPVISSTFPLGIQRGTEATIQLFGVFLPTQTVHVRASADQADGSRLTLTFPGNLESPLGVTSLLVSDLPEVVGNASGVSPMPVPGIANGVIAGLDASQLWRFKARKGQRLILEVNAHRIGSPLDSYLEILDLNGKPVPRAQLRAMGVTYVAFRDHDSTGPGIRLETWNNLAVDDYLLIGDELARIHAMPRGPDDDCQFYSVDGKRVGFLGTTPRFHSQGAPLYQVQIQPAGKVFPPNGFPTVQVNYRNDDGGPGFGKDSQIIFDPPADGDYVVRIGDSAGTAGPTAGYRLTVRPAQPHFSVRFSPETPNVWKGAGTAIAVTATRFDGYEGPIRVRFTGLPSGLHSPPTTITAGENTTALTLSADADAKLLAKTPQLKLVAEAVIDGKRVTSEKLGGVPKLIEMGDLSASTVEEQVAIKPGEQVGVTVKIERRNGFKGRVPLDVRGLPHGVRVLDVGLNGIMVTENETSRRFTLFAEPWVDALDLPIVVLARNEKKGTEVATKPVTLQILKTK